MGSVLTLPVRCIADLTVDQDGLYRSPHFGTLQSEEIRIRTDVAVSHSSNFLEEIAQHHSIEVMKSELQKFLKNIPVGGIILDVGGGWGWHWRNLAVERPDLKVIIVDFVRENLFKAKYILGDQVGKSIFLVHGDGTCLPFENQSFDGYWSVQTLQHVVDFKGAINEAFRVLKQKAYFANYSLNDQPLVRFIYNLFGKQYHVQGVVEGRYYLERASDSQMKVINEIFNSKLTTRYTEILFKPELNCPGSGSIGSIIGKIDSFLSSGLSFFKLLARQQSFHIQK